MNKDEQKEIEKLKAELSWARGYEESRRLGRKRYERIVLKQQRLRTYIIALAGVLIGIALACLGFLVVFEWGFDWLIELFERLQ